MNFRLRQVKRLFREVDWKFFHLVVCEKARSSHPKVCYKKDALKNFA